MTDTLSVLVAWSTCRKPVSTALTSATLQHERVSSAWYIQYVSYLGSDIKSPEKFATAWAATWELMQHLRNQGAEQCA